MNQRQPSSGGDNSGTWLAMLVLLLLGGGFLGIAGMASLPVFGLLLVLLFFAGFGSFNYWLWGKRLEEKIAREDEENEDLPEP